MKVLEIYPFPNPKAENIMITHAQPNQSRIHVEQIEFTKLEQIELRDYLLKRWPLTP